MSDEEAKQLLIEAGMSEERITPEAIMIASVIGEAISRRAASLLAERIVASAKFGRERPEGAVDFQGVACKCGFVELRFGILPRTECPECHAPIEGEWPEVIEQ